MHSQRSRALGQAAACLHTMYLLQAYQVELLGDHDGGGGCCLNTVCKLRRATYLSGLWQHLVAT